RAECPLSGSYARLCLYRGAGPLSRITAHLCVNATPTFCGANMNKRERLLATSRREPADRIPVAFWRHFPGDDQRASDLAQATIAFQERYDFDFVKVSPSNSFVGEDWGAK